MQCFVMLLCRVQSAISQCFVCFLAYKWLELNDFNARGFERALPTHSTAYNNICPDFQSKEFCKQGPGYRLFGPKFYFELSETGSFA